MSIEQRKRMIPVFRFKDVKFGNKRLCVSLTEFENAVVAFFWEGDAPRLGTLTVTLPDRSYSPLLGERDRQLGLILGAHLTSITGKMALISINFSLSTGEVAGKILVELSKMTSLLFFLRCRLGLVRLCHRL